MQQVVEVEKVFFEDDFSINKFLAKSTQKSDLAALRVQLKTYGSVLHNSMTEILKTETESIVDLAENLTNIDSKISNLILPTSQLREEILTLNNTVKTNRETYNICLERIEKNRRNQHAIKLKSNLLEARKKLGQALDNNGDSNILDLLAFERVTNNYALEASFMKQLAIQDDINVTSTMNVDNRLFKMINNEFLNALHTKDVDVMVRCLRMIINLGAERETEKIYREKILRRKLTEIFSQRSLEAVGDDLEQLYGMALQVLNEDMSLLLGTIEKTAPLRAQFDFPLNAFWAECDHQVAVGLPHVSAPGNPEQFHRRFTATWRFLNTVAQRCGDADLVRRDERFKAHLDRFNLPVYFEICYQQISCGLEGAVLKGLEWTLGAAVVGAEVAGPEPPVRLPVTSTLMDCVNLCLSPDIFIAHLSAQFMKLSMLLLTRYLSWFPTFTQQFRAMDSSAQAQHQAALIYLLSDLAYVEKAMGSGCGSGSGGEPRVSVYYTCYQHLGHIVNEVTRCNKAAIDATFATTVTFIVDLKADELVQSLQNVNAIPRLYRKTNRAIPTAPSAYVVEVTELLITFHRNFSQNVSDKALNIADNIVFNVTKKYILLVSDVLHSVSKTEESLKRLKSRSVQPGNVTESIQTLDVSSDNYKIREQIRLDVGHFVLTCAQFCEDPTKIELNHLANCAGAVTDAGGNIVM